MAAHPAAWVARIGAALCIAGRWLAAGSLALTASALIAAATAPRPAAALAALALVAVLGAAQLYLALRIEFDRAVFDAAAQVGFEGFDQALGETGLRRGAVPARTPQARVAGLASLLRWSAGLLAAQFLLWLAALCLQR